MARVPIPRQAPIEATWEEAKEYAERVPAKYLECRVRRRHSWRPRSVIPQDNGYMDITERCTDCRSTCFYIINSRGIVVLPRRITHSDGYLSTKGTGRIVGDALGALRLEWIVRKIPKIGASDEDGDG